MKVRHIATSAGVLTWVVLGDARAAELQYGTLSIGPIWGFAYDVPDPNLGLEVDWLIYPDLEFVGAGPLFQWQPYPDGSDRLALAAQFHVWFAGVEAGWAYYTAGDHDAASHGLHLAPYAAFAPLSLAIRVTKALDDRPVETTLLLGLKLPLPAPDVPFKLSVPHGRPLRGADGSLRVAPVVSGHAAGDDGRWLAVDLRHAAAQAWLRAARLEHASIATFNRLALSLLALGAPTELLAATQRAAQDEVGHTSTCLALASELAGQTLSLGPLPEAIAPHAPLELAALAVESLRDGAVGEGMAAALLRHARRTTTEPALRAALGRMAREEARHAQLGWAIIAWATRVGGAPVRRALLRAAGDELDPRPAPSDADDPRTPRALSPPRAEDQRRLAALGLPSPDDELRVSTRVVRAARRRLLSDLRA